MVQPQTLATIIDNGSQVLASLFKDRMVHKREQEQLEQKMQMRKEIAEIENQGTQPAQSSQPEAAVTVDASDDPLRAAEDLANEYYDILESARQTEDCGMCEMLIEAISQRSLSVQRKALPELRVLKQKADQGASTEELKQYIKETDVLKAVMKEETQRRQQERSQNDSGQSRLSS